MASNDALSIIASNYVTERDNFAARYRARSSGIIAASAGGPMAFNALVTNHAVGLAAVLPPMTLAQWEGLSELTSSYLAHLRMIEAAK
jgi:hypothetical protein